MQLYGSGVALIAPSAGSGGARPPNAVWYILSWKSWLWWHKINNQPLRPSLGITDNLIKSLVSYNYGAFPSIPWSNLANRCRVGTPLLPWDFSELQRKFERPVTVAPTWIQSYVRLSRSLAQRCIKLWCDMHAVSCNTALTIEITAYFACDTVSAT